MRTTKLITISLPSDLLKKIEQLARKEHRTRSEFVRETVRQYLAREELRELNR
ncbi:MAG: CopG family ribbon-helix-helix protein, partial [Candidatus Latescibacterota bacterium]